MKSFDQEMNKSQLKLGVEVIGANNLLSKDGNGTSNRFAELLFDNQRHRTTVKDRELVNPNWEDTFFFTISDPTSLHRRSLEVSLYEQVEATDPRTFLGRVTLSGTSFVPFSDAVVLHYPLQKRGVFCRGIRGELGLRVFITDQKVSGKAAEIVEKRHEFHHLPKKMKSQNPNPNPSHGHGNEKKVEHDHGHDHNHHHHHVGVIDQAARETAAAAQVPTKLVRVYSEASVQPVDYALKETSPLLGGGRVVGGKVVRGGGWPYWGAPSRDHKAATSAYDLVEKMYFLYVRVVKARDLLGPSPAAETLSVATGGIAPFVEVRVGNYKGVTRHFEGRSNPEWGQVFAFSRERIQATVIEAVVKDKNLVARDEFIGVVRFDVNEVPLRVPPDSPLAPEWYRLEDKKGQKLPRGNGELMLAVWIGTQADEAFPDAWHSDAASLASAPAESSAGAAAIRAKVYHSPRLWYLRVTIIEAQDLVSNDKTRPFTEVCVKARLGHQIFKTKPVRCNQTPNAAWNEDLIFVAAEPFDETLVLSVEDRVGPGKDEILGQAYVSVTAVERRADDRVVPSRWLNLEKPVLVDIDKLKKEKFLSRIHVRICLDGGYHVLDESMHYSSDLRPTARQLWRPPVGLLELGILGASALHPLKNSGSDGKATIDTYCVAKYGQKWVRTRTLVGDLSPKYNEQYTWEVFDPATVLTVGVFDNSQVSHREGGNNRDQKIGKVRIRISTLEARRIYTHSYPLLILGPTGVKKTGELHLAVRFTCTSLPNILYAYSKPLLPRMHYLRPLGAAQQDMLRHHAVAIAAARLARAEPPLKKEVIEYMSDNDFHLWSMRRSKANFFRLMAVFSGVFASAKWLGEVRGWTNPATTVLVHCLFLTLTAFPELILPTMFLYMSLIGAWNYRFRPRYPPHMNARLSGAETANADEMDEEFDTFPTGRGPDVVRMRYDRLRSVAGRIQAAVGDLAAQGERVQALLSWRDPRATAVFVLLCLVSTLVTYIVPFQLGIAVAGLYWMRHPRFRHRLPSVPVNFFRRLPARTDCML